MKIRMKFFIFIIGLIICFPGFTTYPSCQELPFQPGEKLTFNLTWNLIPAGTATLEVLPVETMNGVESLHFVFTAKTTPFLDHIYKVRNRVDSYTDTNMTRSVLYKKTVQEGRRKADIEVTFNWEENLAQYSNFGVRKKPIPIQPGTFDPFSIFYYARMLDIGKGPEINQPVTDGRQFAIGAAKVIKRETINVPTGKYDAYLIEPDLKNIGGVFSKNPDAKIYLWVSADQHKIPVKVKSSVTIGSFVGELVSVENLKSR